MKRHASLVALSRDHHAGLVMSKRIADCTDVSALADMCEVVTLRFSSELQPHFEEEEAHIFPPLAGMHDTQRMRALDEHATLRALVERIGEGDCDALLQFGALLTAHIRFEERELFPLYENLIGAA